MFLSTLFSLPVDVSLADLCLEKETLILVLKASQTSAVCPKCTHPSTRIRGRYTRTLADLPSLGRAVRVRLEVRRFVCRTRGCPCATFAEGFPQLTRDYARRTLRQAEALVEIAFAQGGKAGAQLAKRLAMPTSRDTLLRLIRSTPVPTRKTGQVLGLDDFAWKKGDRYIGFRRGLWSWWHGLPFARNGSLLLHPLEELLVVLANSNCLTMLRTERLLVDRQSTLVERRRLLVLALLLIERCQVMQRLCHLRVSVSQRLFLDGQSLLQESFGLFLPSLP
jgi:hypothetical protein